MTRNYGIDLLRYGLMSLGILLHSLCPYLTAGIVEEYPILDPKSSHWGADAIVLVIHSFRMPLFFMIAGYFSYYNFQRKGSLAFAKRRSLRIALPLAVAALTLLNLFGWLIDTFLPLTSQVFGKEVSPNRASDGFALSYLWFLNDLVWITVLMLFLKPAVTVFSRAARSFRYFKTNKNLLAHLFFSDKPQDELKDELQNGFYFTLPVLLFFVTAGVVFQGKGLIPTHDHWWPDFMMLFFYGSYFLVGCILYQRQRTQNHNQSHNQNHDLDPPRCSLGVKKPKDTTPILIGTKKIPPPVILGFKAFSLIFLMGLYLKWTQLSLRGSHSAQIGAAMVHGVLTPWICFNAWGFFSKTKVRRKAPVRYLADSSYSGYLFHPLVMVPLVFVVQPLSSVLLKTVVVFLGSTTLSLGLYHGLVRKTFLKNYI